MFSLQQVKFGKWLAKLAARLLATAALSDRIKTSPKNTKWVTYRKQGSGQHILARQKYTKKWESLIFQGNNISKDGKDLKSESEEHFDEG